MSSIISGKASLVGVQPTHAASSDPVRELFQQARDTDPTHRGQAASAYTQLLRLAGDKDADPKIRKQAAHYASAIKTSGIAAGFKAAAPSQNARAPAATLPGTALPSAQSAATAAKPPPVPPRPSLQPPVPPRPSALAPKPNSTRALAGRVDAVATALATPLRQNHAIKQTDEELLAELERAAAAPPPASKEFSEQELAELAQFERELAESPKAGTTQLSAQDLADLAELEAMEIALRG